MDKQLPSVSDAVEGVDFEVVINGLPCPAWIASDLLDDWFGADGSASGWLSAYEAHRATIESLATRMFFKLPKLPVLLWEPMLRRYGVTEVAGRSRPGSKGRRAGQFGE
jgi:hypothetical protein